MPTFDQAVSLDVSSHAPVAPTVTTSPGRVGVKSPSAVPGPAPRATRRPWGAKLSVLIAALAAFIWGWLKGVFVPPLIGFFEPLTLTRLRRPAGVPRSEAKSFPSPDVVRTMPKVRVETHDCANLCPKVRCLPGNAHVPLRYPA